MKIDMGRFLNDKEQMLRYLARENVVPVKAPPWSGHPFELRRNDKTIRGQIGRHMVSKGLTPIVMELLGIRDERCCKDVGERIKLIRQELGYK